MSYILEALRKSEKERKRDEIPTLQDISAPRQAARTRQKSSPSRLLRGLSALVILLTLTLGVMLARKWIATGTGGQDVIQKKPQSLPEVQGDENNRGGRQNLEMPGEKKPRNLSENGSDTDRQRITEKSSHDSPSIIREPAPLRLAPQTDDTLVFNRQNSNAVPPRDLPLAIQDDLRKMRFAGHAYSRDRALRLIMINNKILHEGDPVDVDLRLSEITENGVVLLYHARRIRINLF
jgi:general secretion pathway protein B